ncbi:transcriptional regulatory protein, partial [Streptomyces clavuligerus]
GLPPDRLPAARRHLAELTPMLALPSVREAVLATADHHELPFLRHRVAHALYRHGGPASDIAPLLLDTPQTGAPWIVHTLEEAAEHALRTGAPDHAARILRHALGGPVAPARHCSLTLRLSALDMLHSSRSGIRRLHESLQRADCHDPCAVSEALSGALAAQGHVDTAIRVLEDTGRTIDDEQLTAVVRVGVAALASQDARTWHHAADEMRTLAPHAPESVEPLVCALLTIHEGGTGRIDAHTAVQRVTARLHAPVHPRLRTAFTAGAAAVLEWADHLDEARGLLARELPALPALPVALDLTSQAHLHLFTVHATVERKLGRFRHLVDRLTPLLDGVRDPAVRLPYLRALTAHAWHELGRTDLAHRHLDALGAFDEPGVSWEWEEVLHTRARIHLDSGEWQQALTAYRRCGERHAVRGFVNPVGQPWRSGAAIALAHLSRHTEARALADEGLRYAHAWGTPRHIGTALRARALTLGGRERLETLEEAARVLGTAPAPTELIETLTDLGRAQIVSGRRRKGRETLRDAQGLARTLLPAAPGPATDVLSTGAGPLTPRLVALVDAALRASESGRPCRRTDPSPALLPVDELTSAERRIVELAVQGLTNDQICASLHLARRTVESHLTKAYRKLGVTRRTQLATRLAVGAATTGR